MIFGVLYHDIWRVAAIYKYEIITTRAVVLDFYLHCSVISRAELAYNTTETSVELNELLINVYVILFILYFPCNVLQKKFQGGECAPPPPFAPPCGRPWFEYKAWNDCKFESDKIINIRKNCIVSQWRNYGGGGAWGEMV